MFQGELIAGGQFTTAGTTNASSIAAWNGATWRGLGSGIVNSSWAANVQSLVVHLGELIVGGSFTHAGGSVAADLAAWNGSAWRPLVSGVPGGQTFPGVLALASFRGDLIIGDASGVLKLLFHRRTLQLLGVHVIGEAASELIHIGQTVMGFQGTVDYLSQTVFNYPTLSQAYKTAALDGMNKVIATQGLPDETAVPELNVH